jgi:hypothetical protein
VPRSLDDYAVGLPAEERARIETRANALVTERAALAELHEMLAPARHAAATQLSASGTSVQKMERRVDLYLAALRDTLQAIGGDLEIVIRLPGRPPMQMTGFEGLLGSDRPER